MNDLCTNVIKAVFWNHSRQKMLYKGMIIISGFQLQWHYFGATEKLKVLEYWWTSLKKSV